MFNVSGGELFMILVVALVVLGPERLPVAARKVGQVMGQLRDLSDGFRREVSRAVDDPGEPIVKPRSRNQPQPRPQLTALEGGASEPAAAGSDGSVPAAEEAVSGPDSTSPAVGSISNPSPGPRAAAAGSGTAVSVPDEWPPITDHKSVRDTISARTPPPAQVDPPPGPVSAAAPDIDGGRGKAGRSRPAGDRRRAAPIDPVARPAPASSRAPRKRTGSGDESAAAEATRPDGTASPTVGSRPAPRASRKPRATRRPAGTAPTASETASPPHDTATGTATPGSDPRPPPASAAPRDG